MDRKVNCICDEFEKIYDFRSLNEFKRFLAYLDALVKEGSIIEILVKHKYFKGNIDDENWYKCVGCNQKWRLVYPDFPFAGVWERIDN